MAVSTVSDDFYETRNFFLQIIYGAFGMRCFNVGFFHYQHCIIIIIRYELKKRTRHYAISGASGSVMTHRKLAGPIFFSFGTCQ